MVLGLVLAYVAAGTVAGAAVRHRLRKYHSDEDVSILAWLWFLLWPAMTPLYFLNKAQHALLALPGAVTEFRRRRAFPRARTVHVLRAPGE